MQKVWNYNIPHWVHERWGVRISLIFPTSAIVTRRDRLHNGTSSLTLNTRRLSAADRPATTASRPPTNHFILQNVEPPRSPTSNVALWWTGDVQHGSLAGRGDVHCGSSLTPDAEAICTTRSDRVSRFPKPRLIICVSFRLPWPPLEGSATERADRPFGRSAWPHLACTRSWSNMAHKLGHPANLPAGRRRLPEGRKSETGVRGGTAPDV